MVEARRARWSLVALALALTLALPMSVLAGVQAQTPTAAQAMVRMVQASPDSPPVNMVLGSNRLFCSVPFKGITRYAYVTPGTYDVRVAEAPLATGGPPSSVTPSSTVTPSASVTPLASATPSGPGAGPAATATVAAREIATGSTDLMGGDSYSTLLVGLTDTAELLVLRDDLSAPPAGQVKVRFVNVAPNSNPLDLKVANGATVASNISYKQASDYNNIPPGTVELQLVEAGTSNAVATMPGVNMVGDVVYTIYALGLKDGQPPLQPLMVVESVGGMPVTTG